MLDYARPFAGGVTVKYRHLHRSPLNARNASGMLRLRSVEMKLLARRAAAADFLPQQSFGHLPMSPSLPLLEQSSVHLHHHMQRSPRAACRSIEPASG